LENAIVVYFNLAKRLAQLAAAHETASAAAATLPATSWVAS